MRIEVEFDGLSELDAALTLAGKEIRRLPRAFGDIRNRVMRTGASEAPRYRGATVDSMQGKASNLKAEVSAGGSQRASDGGGFYVASEPAGTPWDGAPPAHQL